MLGRAESIEAVLEGLLVEKGARVRFEPHTPPDPSLEGRVDLRDRLTFTIDSGKISRLDSSFADQAAVDEFWA